MVTKSSLQSEVDTLKSQLDMYKLLFEQIQKEKADLLEALTKSQEALVSKAAPDAYRNQMFGDLNSIADVPDKENRQRKREIVDDYLRRMEDDTWDDADSMISDLTKAIGMPKNNSVHDNDES